MKKLLIFLTAALAFAAISCNKTSGDVAEDHALDYTAVKYATDTTAGITQYNAFKGECDAIMNDGQYKYQGKRNELISQLDSVMAKYQKKAIYGDVILYAVGSTVSDKTQLKTWKIEFGGVIIDIDDDDDE